MRTGRSARGVSVKTIVAIAMMIAASRSDGIAFVILLSLL